MSAPQRIQRQRTKGWRMPAGAIYVGRPSRWGNPYTIINAHSQGWLIFDDTTPETGSLGYLTSHATQAEARRESVSRFRKSLTPSIRRQVESELAGRDLACWCPLDQPCHADVLLEIANGGAA